MERGELKLQQVIGPNIVDILLITFKHLIMLCLALHFELIKPTFYIKIYYIWIQDLSILDFLKNRK